MPFLAIRPNFGPPGKVEGVGSGPKHSWHLFSSILRYDFHYLVISVLFQRSTLLGTARLPSHQRACAEALSKRSDVYVLIPATLKSFVQLTWYVIPL